VGLATHWKAPPCHGAHGKRSLRIALCISQDGRGRSRRRSHLKVAQIGPALAKPPIAALTSGSQTTNVTKPIFVMLFGYQAADDVTTLLPLVPCRVGRPQGRPSSSAPHHAPGRQ
jgi:hypothetical protein